jgi:hypothetical protein
MSRLKPRPTKRIHKAHPQSAPTYTCKQVPALSDGDLKTTAEVDWHGWETKQPKNGPILTATCQSIYAVLFSLKRNVPAPSRRTRDGAAATNKHYMVEAVALVVAAHFLGGQRFVLSRTKLIHGPESSQNGKSRWLKNSWDLWVVPLGTTKRAVFFRGFNP